MKYVDLAFAAVEERPQVIVLLGITPDALETGYGWIEPAPAGAGQRGTRLRSS
jgi:mannose-1-phosphate guanylyltransferase